MLTAYEHRRMQRVQRRVEELRLWRDVTDSPIGPITLTAADGIAPPATAGVGVRA